MYYIYLLSVFTAISSNPHISQGKTEPLCDIRMSTEIIIYQTDIQNSLTFYIKTQKRYMYFTSDKWCACVVCNGERLRSGIEKRDFLWIYCDTYRVKSVLKVTELISVAF